MEVILKETIPSLGKAGDMVKVANGYARNFLLPKGKAIFASRKNISQLERQQAFILAKAAKERDEFDALATKLGELDISIPVRVGEKDRLYGSVTSLDIANAIESQGYSIDRKKIQMDEPIKALGEFEIPIRLSTDVRATVKVSVVPLESV
ncbi:MAG: 50S ribosomal protein L9 [Deltaproteobacteria bacterium]|nr:50S ribosomal protein L9 [Deltaproteobacteria bacterium]MBW1946489.1 50S ribosomal protein L9 [Deltaproteobacteria bacterium]MBW1965983.1 50S ribosomal protein L9 [Deltaproteobacteria bacterium]MBW2097419.1 50S ribosomal protein L9 [Deltaproteobacteria bacterium]PXF54762.1 MAG: 50S ribosomal protein L9 [Deltaproteobacteria bacterium]